MNKFKEDDYIMISGLEHYLFCKRQWALIHMEQVWQENIYTVEGEILHEKADLPFLKEKRGNIIISRAMPVKSSKYGITGILDIIEFINAEEGIPLKNKKGFWKPNIVEYKRGRKKKDVYDEVQLMAQALCIEEEFGIELESGDIFYFETKTRERIEFNNSLRSITIQTIKDIHDFVNNYELPKAEFFKNCEKCSLVEICMPRITKKKKSIENYLFGEYND